MCVAVFGVALCREIGCEASQIEKVTMKEASAAAIPDATPLPPARRMLQAGEPPSNDMPAAAAEEPEPAVAALPTTPVELTMVFHKEAEVNLNQLTARIRNLMQQEATIAGTCPLLLLPLMLLCGLFNILLHPLQISCIVNAVRMLFNILTPIMCAPKMSNVISDGYF